MKTTSTEPTTEQKQQFADDTQPITVEDIPSFVHWYTCNKLDNLNKEFAFAKTKTCADVMTHIKNERLSLWALITRRLPLEVAKNSTVIDQVLNQIAKMDAVIKEWYLTTEIKRHEYKSVIKRLTKLRSGVLVSPDGKEYEVYNQSAFCREHRLNQGNINQVLLGKSKHHKGWTKKQGT